MPVVCNLCGHSYEIGTGHTNSDQPQARAPLPPGVTRTPEELATPPQSATPTQIIESSSMAAEQSSDPPPPNDQTVVMPAPIQVEPQTLTDQDLPLFTDDSNAAGAPESDPVPGLGEVTQIIQSSSTLHSPGNAPRAQTMDNSPPGSLAEPTMVTQLPTFENKAQADQDTHLIEDPQELRETAPMALASTELYPTEVSETEDVGQTGQSAPGDAFENEQDQPLGSAAPPKILAALQPAQELALKIGAAVGLVPAAPLEFPDDSRRYYRVPSVVPVNYRIISTTEGPLDTEVRTAFTEDLSQTGLCLSIRSLPPLLFERLSREKTDDLRLEMDISMRDRTVRVLGSIAWSKAIENSTSGGLSLGIAFEDIDPLDSSAVLSFAKRAARKPFVIRGSLAAVAMVLLIVALSYRSSVSTQQEALNAADQQLSAAEKRYQSLAQQLQTQTGTLEKLTQQIRGIVSEGNGEDGEDAAAEENDAAMDSGLDGDVQDLESESESVAAASAAAVEELSSGVIALQQLTSDLQKKVITLAKVKKRERKRSKKRRKRRRR